MQKRGLDGLIVSLPANISYLLNFTSRDSYLLVSDKANTYFTDSRYTAEVKAPLKTKAVLKKTNGSVFKLISQACISLKLKRIGFEERHLAFAEYKKIKEYLKKQNLIPTHSIIEQLRQIKEAQEVEKIREAIGITDEALKYATEYIRPGIEEIELAAELERLIRKKGAAKSSFDIIAASGPNSCYPHHIPTKRKLKQNEPVLIDIGVEYQGYKSDLTRVYFLGRISVLAQKIYNIVLKAQEEALKSIKPGIAISKIDQAARQYITRAGYGKQFSHNLGHGVGLEVHEEPHISSKETGKLKPGMVFTIEPAIYLPGEFGVRLEDMVLVTDNGCEVLSGAVNK